MPPISFSSPRPRRAAVADWVLLGLALGALGGCGLPGRVASPEVRSPIDATELGEVQACFLCGDVYLGSLPDEEAIELASRRGIQTVVDVTPLGYESRFSIAASAREHLSLIHI